MCTVDWCLAEGLVNGDQRRRTGSGNALEAFLRWCATKTTFNLLHASYFICEHKYM